MMIVKERNEFGIAVTAMFNDPLGKRLNFSEGKKGMQSTVQDHFKLTSLSEKRKQYPRNVSSQ